MADIADEDPYAVSSDSDSEEASPKKKAPPPKIEIEGRSNADIKLIKESLISEENKQVSNEKTLEEIAQLRKIKGAELSKMRKDFEEGTVINDPEALDTKTEPVVTGLDKQTLSAFKDKFEKIDNTLEQNLEERLKFMEKNLEGVGKENLANMKGMFEGGEKEFSVEQKEELLSLQKTDADRKRVLAAFSQAEKGTSDVDDNNGPKNCCICDKVVYPVERVVASKKIYHVNCFKCSKCDKKLSSTTFNSHQGLLYCRTHMLEVLHPERAGTFGAAEGEDEEGQVQADDDDDEEEYAVCSKPKQLGADVVRAGNTNIGDELSQLKSSLKNKKESWQTSVNEAQQGLTAVNRQQQLAEEIEAGKVKANLDKLASAGESETVDDEEKRKQLDAIREQVSEVKNKWKTGDLEKVDTAPEAASKEELEELKKGIKVKERFSERLQPTDFSDENKSYNKSELENSSAAEARKSFLEGLAYQSGPVEKAAASDLQELKFTGLNSFKDRFEKGTAEEHEAEPEKSALDIHIQLKSIKQALQESEKSDDNSPEARAERKKIEIEAEFLRYKLARKLQSKRQKEGEQAEGADFQEKDEIPSAEVDSIKNRFEAGKAFQSRVGGGEKPDLDVDIKMAGKAREKFKNIEAQNPQSSAPVPGGKSDAKLSKWDKKTTYTNEVVNKRAVTDEDSDEDEEAFDVKNLMNKFKNIGNMEPAKIERKLDELEALRVEAKNLRQRFEGSLAGDEEQSEEKKKQLEEEFKLLKEEREKAKKELEAEQEETGIQNIKEEVQVAADHASKMTAKWEKIHKKEAKKAQKGQMPQKGEN